MIMPNVFASGGACACASTASAKDVQMSSAAASGVEAMKCWLALWCGHRLSGLDLTMISPACSVSRLRQLVFSFLFLFFLQSHLIIV